jgi:hypothetical protein
MVLLTIPERWAWLEILTYCARYRTSGHVTRGVRSAVASATPKLLAKLVQVRLLDEAEDGWKVHDWDEYNPKDPTAAARAKRYRDRDTTRDEHRNDTVTADRDAAVTRTAPRARASAAVPRPQPQELRGEGEIKRQALTGPTNGAHAEEPANEYLITKLLILIGNHADPGTEHILRTLANKLPDNSLAKVTESLDQRRPRPTNRAAYTIAALQAEHDARTAAAGDDSEKEGARS